MKLLGVGPPGIACVCFGLVRDKPGNITHPADFYPAPCMATGKSSGYMLMPLVIKLWLKFSPAKEKEACLIFDDGLPLNQGTAHLISSLIWSLFPCGIHVNMCVI